MKRRDLLKRLVTVPIIGKLISETPVEVKPVVPEVPPPPSPQFPRVVVPQYGDNLTSCTVQVEIGRPWWTDK